MGQDIFLDRTVASSKGGTAVAHAAPRKLALSARDWRAFDRGDRIGAWDALAQWASEPNPFLESWYLISALREFDPQGRVQLLTLEADGQIAGLLPVVRRTSYYGHPLPHLASWTHGNSFLGTPLVAHGFEGLFWRELLRWADRHTRIALFLHLTALSAGGQLHKALAQVLAENARPAATVHREERAMLASSLDATDYAEQAIPAKKRKELRRQQRRLSEEGELRFETSADAEAIESWAEEFLALEARGWKGDSGSALAGDPRTTALFTRALHGAAQRGRLGRVTMRLDGRAIAMLANFLTPPGAFSFKTAFDEDYARYSPGVLLQLHNLAILDRDEIDWADSCAAGDHPMIDHIWRERRTILRHSIAIGGPIRRAAFSALIRRETGSAAGAIA